SAILAKCLIINVLRLIIVILFFIAFLNITYTARHTWATLAYHSGVPVGLISQSLGHSSIRVTMTYLKPFDAEVIDRINRQVISLVKKSKKKKDGRFNMLYGTSLR
ncbi:tyrosine-type recombinase/integrase, partial [Bacteroides sp.]|uniref:tyrosine-type recombinase/integrase n=1 Tax=Bacteroides sp. TaxID=29523 RepID=UPI0025BD1717